MFGLMSNFIKHWTNYKKLEHHSNLFLYCNQANQWRYWICYVLFWQMIFAWIIHFSNILHDYLQLFILPCKAMLYFMFESTGGLDVWVKKRPFPTWNLFFRIDKYTEFFIKTHSLVFLLNILDCVFHTQNALFTIHKYCIRESW